MSSPVRLSTRRRSQSASSPIRGPQYTDDRDDSEWKIATKRARPTYPRSPSHHDLPLDKPPEKWDVDQWRRGKRARRDMASGVRDEEYILSAGPCDIEGSDLARSAVSALPSTSAAFQLFPSHRKARRTLHQGVHRPDTASRKSNMQALSEDLHQLRSDAFGELHRSVAESGEGLVRRMRDWEDSRTGPSDAPGPRRRSTRQNTGMAAPTPEVEDEDVEIVSGDVTPDAQSFHTRSPSHKKRAYSLGTMEADLPEVQFQPSTPTDGSECCSSPLDASAYSSDDDELGPAGTPFGVASTPALSRTYTSSSNSSLISLPHDASHHPIAPFSFLRTAPRHLQALPVPSTASRSEKALAALTLAMANGAGGLNDYEALRQAEGTSSGETCDIGELWH